MNFDNADPLLDVLRASAVRKTILKMRRIELEEHDVSVDFFRKVKQGNLYNIINRIHTYSFDSELRFWKMLVSMMGPDGKIIYMILLAHCSKDGFFKRGFCDMILSYNYQRLIKYSHEFL